MPAILPVALVLVAGWWQVFDFFEKRLGVMSYHTIHFFIAFLLTLNFFSLLSTIKFFDPAGEQEYLIFFVSLILAFVLIFKWFSPASQLKLHHEKGTDCIKES